MDWLALMSALGLCLIAEGLLPFVNPNFSKRIMLSIIRMGDLTLRLMGFITMLLGVVVLYFVR